MLAMLLGLAVVVLVLVVAVSASNRDPEWARRRTGRVGPAPAPRGPTTASGDTAPWLAASVPAWMDDSTSTDVHHAHGMEDVARSHHTHHHHVSGDSTSVDVGGHHTHHHHVSSDSSSVDLGGHHTSHDHGSFSDSSGFDAGGGHHH